MSKGRSIGNPGPPPSKTPTPPSATRVCKNSFVDHAPMLKIKNATTQSVETRKDMLLCPVCLLSYFLDDAAILANARHLFQVTWLHSLQGRPEVFYTHVNRAMFVEKLFCMTCQAWGQE
jgi:hypothetical protein